VLAAAWTSAASEPLGPTVKDVIEFTRIIQPLNHDGDALQSQVSPDSQHAFIVTRKADVTSDQNRFDILLLDVGQERLAIGKVGEAARLWTLEAAKDPYDADPPLRDARWVGNRTLVFRARLRDEPFQVYRLDIASRQLTQLTFEPLGLVSFDVTSDLTRVVYVAPVPHPPIAPGARSVVVGTNSFWSIHGPNDLGTQLRRYRYMVAEAGSREPARALGGSFAESSGGGGSSSVSISPDGRWALLPRFDPTRQADWGRKYPRIGELTAKFGPSVALDPLGYYSRPQAYVPRRLIAYRLADGREQAVLDAPDDSTQSNQQRLDRLWQPGGHSVVIAGTYLPRAAIDAITDGASHIVEYWPESGRWKDIAVLKQNLKEALPVAGKPDAFVAIDGDVRRRFEKGADGDWLELPQEPHEQETRDAGVDARGSTWRLRVDEALNQPPDIVAVGPAGESLRLTQLNPQFAAATWGTMREYRWKDAKGRQWNGGLMVPTNFDPSVKHALVIQTYGFAPDRFYRDGTNTFEGATSGFPGRAFLREDILVLAMPTRAATGEPEDLHERTVSFTDGVSAAIESLVAQGAVDRNKIGIIGWSATGAQVLNLVTFTDTPIRAASMVDGDSNTLFSMTITYSVLDGIQLKKESLNQGGPFGATLNRWIRNDPSLHTDCIRAALRFEAYGPHVHNNWDLYALLRRQYRPVEMIVFPEGAHSLSRPSERLISLQGNVDWYRFWLKGERRSELVLPNETAAVLKGQYARWDQMADMKRAVDRTPACVRTANDG
jgi:dipeptidyl aminopeptidase/acylaminoacyl peptidase